MSMFIRVDVDESIQQDEEAKKRVVEVCPLDIFAIDESGRLVTVEENLDECTLSLLCEEAANRRVKVVKLYEE